MEKPLQRLPIHHLIHKYRKGLVLCCTTLCVCLCTQKNMADHQETSILVGRPMREFRDDLGTRWIKCVSMKAMFS